VGSRLPGHSLRHVHALLLSGQRALSKLFSEFEQDLARAAAVPLRAGLDVRMERPGYDPLLQRDLGRLSYAVYGRQSSAPSDGGRKASLTPPASALPDRAIDFEIGQCRCPLRNSIATAI
jgi:hypothetical protein